MEKYMELQNKTISENKNSYKTKNGITYINVVECDRMYWNATSIIEFLMEDMNKIGVKNNFNHLSYSQLNKLLCRIINRYEITELDKKVKEWFVRNNRRWDKEYYGVKESNRELNKLIRNNYVFYYDNRHGTLYR